MALLAMASAPEVAAEEPVALVDRLEAVAVAVAVLAARLPPIERQRQLRSDEAPSSDEGPSSDARLMSSIGNGHYSGGKVRT